VPVAAPERSGARIEPGYRGFLRLCRLLGFDIEPYQRRIARAAFGDTRELVVVVPKGNFKTTMCSLIGLHHLLVTPDAEVRIGAGVRRQAEICRKRMKGFARNEAIRDRITMLETVERPRRGFVRQPRRGSGVSI
jgi:hypothetical protein